MIKNKQNIGNIILAIGILIIIIILLVLKLQETVVYEYYINGKTSPIQGINLTGWDCTNDVKIAYDETFKRYKANNERKKATCKLYFEDNIYDEISNLVDSGNDDLILDKKITRNVAKEVTYYGKDAKNYVYFNCDDYTKQSSATCEVFRILKLENINNDKKSVKLIKDRKLEVFDKTNNTTLDKFSWYYTKDVSELLLTESNIYDLLNTGYLNSDNDYQYIDNKNNIHHLDFSKSGIKNKATRNMIISADYRVNSDFDTSFKARDWIQNEALGTSMTLNIGLPTISDYLSTIGPVCDEIKVSKFADCSGSSYINIDNSMWTMNVSGLDKSKVFRISNNKTVSPVYPSLEYEVYPNLYISGDLKIIAGDGSKDNPYELM